MRIILAVVTLLATPLALLAVGAACETATCSMTCCAMHGSQGGKGVMCHHESSGQNRQCGTSSGKQMPEFGTISPINPTTLDSHVTLAAPEITRRTLVISRQSAVFGFLSVPFEPPRT